MHVWSPACLHRVLWVICMKKSTWKTYIFWILFSEIVGALSSWLTRDGTKIYNETITQPPFSPPPIVFPIVWGILFALMGIGVARIYLAPASGARSRSILLFLIQLFFNFFGALSFSIFRPLALRLSGWSHCGFWSCWWFYLSEKLTSLRPGCKFLISSGWLLPLTWISVCGFSISHTLDSPVIQACIDRFGTVHKTRACHDAHCILTGSYSSFFGFNPTLVEKFLHNNRNSRSFERLFVSLTIIL